MPPLHPAGPAYIVETPENFALSPSMIYPLAAWEEKVTLSEYPDRRKPTTVIFS
jgi:hypothetical protein